jgi:uncharacterized protein
VNLAGENLAHGLWTASRKRRFRESRFAVTGGIVALIRRLETKPDVLISGSAIGYYGDRGNETLTESSAAQPLFMSELCRHWEERAQQAATAGVRVCRLRIGLVLGAEGGAVKPLALATRLGLGAVMGEGAQIVSWIHIDDLVRLALFTMDHGDLTGPVNAVAPNPTAQREFMRQLGRALHRRVILTVPARLLRTAMGELSSLFLTSQRVLPKAALAAGFEFGFPTIDGAFADLYAASAGATKAAATLAVYMNEACTVCRTELEHYEQLSVEASCPIDFERIGRIGTGLPDYGLCDADLRRRLYVRDRAGALCSGIDAFAALWAELPRYRWASRLLRMPGIHSLCGLLYDGLCVPLLAAWNRRQARRAGAVPS